MLVDVATGGPRIDDVNEDYKARRRRMVPELVRRGLEYPFPWADLWDWYEAYSEEPGGYRARRSRIRKLAAPLVERLHDLASDPGIDDLGALGEQSSDWTQIEGRLASMRQELAQAVSLDDLQDVGRRCREVVIDAARRVFDSTMVPEGTETPGSSDAKAMIGLFLASRAGGSSRRDLRALVRSSHTLMQTVTHSATITRADAIASGSAAVLIVRTLQQLESEHARIQPVVRPRSGSAVGPRSAPAVLPRPATPAAEATPAATEWSAGDRVTHRRFGEGIVVSSRIVAGDEEVTVAFVGQGVKRLIAEFANLTRK
ncbi:MAG: hypothetical protein ABJC24_00135 [Chloroflexota bacterium]